MSKENPKQENASGAIAGVLLVTAIIFGVLVGLGIGLLLHIPAILAVVGGFAGLVLGFMLVFKQFHDI